MVTADRSSSVVTSPVTPPLVTISRKKAAHDFAAAGFRQRIGEADLFRTGEGSNFMADPLTEFFAQNGVVPLAFFQGDEGADGLAGDLMRLANDGGFGNSRMMDERRFNFHGAEAMTADIHDIVDAAENPMIAIIIAAGGVAREIGAGYARPVLFFKTFGIAPNSAHHAGPGMFDDEIAFAIVADRYAFGVDDFGDDAR